MQLGAGRPPVGIVYDSDFGNRVDDALALAVLYGLDGKNECRVVSVTVSKPNLRAAAATEVIGRFYAGAVSGNFGAVGRLLPVGLATEGPAPEDTPILRAILDGKKYEHGILHLNDTAEPHAVIRNAFTAQHDQNCIVVLAGPATNLVRAMNLPGTKAWIEKKVRYLVVSDFEVNAKIDPAAARQLFAEWPTAVYVGGSSDTLPFPGAAIEKDFAWSQAHPVVDAYRAAKPMPYDAGTWDVTAVLQAVRPGEKYFKLSEPGMVKVGGDGRAEFVHSSVGKHRQFLMDPEQRDRTIQTMVELASAKPVVRAPRRPRPAVVAEPAKKQP
jgi:inosine-uridine nucleoside N-ribohydrolase